MRRRENMNQAAAVKPTRPQFHDASLNKALERAAPKIETFTSRLDRLSSDIKQLEAYLEQSAVRVPTRVKLERTPGSYGEYIAWDLGEPDRFRIIYYLQDGDDYESNKSVLIEAPIAVRVRAKARLADLLRAVGEAAQLGQEEDTSSTNDESASGPPSDDDIPF
jgi:hypothetical protein